MKFQESSLAVNTAQTVNEKGIIWDPADSDKLFVIAFQAIGDFLGTMLNKEKIAFVIDDIKGGFMMAAVADYHENGDNGQASYSLAWTTYEEDIEGAKIFNITNPHFINTIAVTALRLFGMKYNEERFIGQLLRAPIETLLAWLDQNASETGVVEVELDGCFKARVAVEDGEKVFAITPLGEVKQFVKNDAGTEK